MSIVESVNKKLFVGFLFAFSILLPGIAQAAYDLEIDGFTNTSNINNYSGGTHFNINVDDESGIMSTSDGGKYDLFDGNPKSV